MFSRRIPRDLRPNALARRRIEGARVLYDLTVSNPTLCGIEYPAGLLSRLGRPEGLVYRPDPLGVAGAREAVAEEYARLGVAVRMDSIVLAASTSEAYSLLFKLLCDPGDAVLVPAPSYPLFAHLAALEGVRAVAYPLDPTGLWQPDLHSVAGVQAKALIAVHPNNPTGTYLAPRSAEDLSSACARRDMALIVDEVFHAYPLPPVVAAASFAGRDGEALTFTLNGLSKHVGLPQAKLAWMVVSGPASVAAEALERLAFVSDNYLSVATPVQLALPHLLREGAAVRRGILARCSRNLGALARAVGDVPGVTLERPGGGWSAVLRFPRVIGEEALALSLLDEDAVAVHPGYFFDFSEEGYLALSLLPPERIFDEGSRRVLRSIAARI